MTFAARLIWSQVRRIRQLEAALVSWQRVVEVQRGTIALLRSQRDEAWRSAQRAQSDALLIAHGMAQPEALAGFLHDLHEIQGFDETEERP